MSIAASHVPSLPPEIAAEIGHQLRAYYAHLLSEPIPGRFARLLKVLDQKEMADHGGLPPEK
jgi:hypothetical protein